MMADTNAYFAERAYLAPCDFAADGKTPVKVQLKTTPIATLMPQEDITSKGIRSESAATTASESGERQSRHSSPSSSNHSLESQGVSPPPGLEDLEDFQRQALKEVDVNDNGSYSGQWMHQMPMMPMMPMMPYPMMNTFSTHPLWPHPSMLPMGAQIEANGKKKKAPPKQFQKENKKDLKKLNQNPSDYSGITTLMIRGIPCSFSQEQMMSLVAGAGLDEHCDFFYLPTAGNRVSNLGYAFINFTETIHAWTCAFTFNGLRLDPARSTKICTVSPADIQGIDNLRKHFRRTFVNRGPRGPLFMGSNKKGLKHKDGKNNEELQDLNSQ